MYGGVRRETDNKLAYEVVYKQRRSQWGGDIRAMPPKRPKGGQHVFWPPNTTWALLRHEHFFLWGLVRADKGPYLADRGPLSA